VARLAAVTGATGFLGRYIVGALDAAGWQVRLLARTDPNHPQLTGTSFETIRGDLSDRRALDRLVDGAELVIHAAGLIKARGATAFRAVNAEGTAGLVAAMNDGNRFGHLLLVSTMAAREPHLSDYAGSKHKGEETLGDLRRGTWTIVRPCAVYGPWDRETLTIFRAAAFGILPLAGPRAGRLALIHAADAADAILALGSEGPSRRVFELTDGCVAGYGWDRIVAALETAIGRKVLPLKLPPIAVRAAAAVNIAAAGLTGRIPIFTPGKAREILHGDWGSTAERLPPPAVWQPRIGLNEGFRDTVSWYRAQGWLPAGAAGPLLAGVTH
jgi:nucleoside-diphosphate-sugar epimerase